MKIMIFLIAACSFLSIMFAAAQGNGGSAAATRETASNGAPVETAMFAGGCFWCMEKPFEALSGVVSVVSGYSGGSTEHPTYQNYSAGGHVEVVRIEFDPSRISYDELLETYWRQINPIDEGGQFVDRGHAYTTAIYYASDSQRQQAEASKARLAASKIFDGSIVTPIVKAGAFYPAEDYHQDYYKKNPIRYAFYRHGSGRDAFLDKVWGKKRDRRIAMAVPRPQDLKRRLSSLEYHVTQEDGTEPPFDNKYWNNKEAGIYVDIVSGEPLFSSRDKYESGTGWPSFTKPLVRANVVERLDHSLFMKRVEVRSREGNSHLGHVFKDGPPPTGLRYCINSAALRFIPVAALADAGYGQFTEMFD